MKHAILSLLLAATLAACTADSFQRVPAPAQESDRPAPAMCRIYILRMPQLKGSVRGVSVKENEREIGRIGDDRYLVWERPAGRSLVIVTYDDVGVHDDPESMIDVDAEAGETYYYGLTIDEAWRRAVVRMLTREEALAIIREQKPASKG